MPTASSKPSNPDPLLAAADKAIRKFTQVLGLDELGRVPVTTMTEEGLPDISYDRDVLARQSDTIRVSITGGRNDRRRAANRPSGVRMKTQLKWE